MTSIERSEYSEKGDISVQTASRIVEELKDNDSYDSEKATLVRNYIVMRYKEGRLSKVNRTNLEQLSSLIEEEDKNPEFEIIEKDILEE